MLLDNKRVFDRINDKMGWKPESEAIMADCRFDGPGKKLFPDYLGSMA